MIYIKHSRDFAMSLMLTPDDERRLKAIIAKAYHSIPDRDFSIDEINALVAPEIKTPEEAYYIAQTIICDILEANKIHGSKKR